MAIMYDPTIGKWLSEDPIGFAGDGSNLYRYVGNSPTQFVDPLGLDVWVPHPPWEGIGPIVGGADAGTGGCAVLAAEGAVVGGVVIIGAEGIAVIYYTLEYQDQQQQYVTTASKCYMDQGYTRATANKMAFQELRKAEQNQPGFIRLWGHYLYDDYFSWL
jgi:uncharacterized protein RhaS with RHS repeats